MDLGDKVPVLILQVLEGDISEDTSVVDQHVDRAELLHRSLNDLVTELDRVVVGNGLTTGLPDLLNNDIGGLYRSAYQLPCLGAAWG